MVSAYQSAGEFLRFNPQMSEYFRRVIIKFFLKKELISAKLATSLINWRHSGFSVDNSIHLPARSTKARKALSQYISRPPLSLKKISIRENGEATVISYTSDNEFFQGKTETFSVSRFLLEVTQHIPPRGSQYIRRYGLYATLRRTARTKGKRPDMPHVERLAPAGWKAERLQASESIQPYVKESAHTVSDRETRSAWARLIAQVYEGCAPRCPLDLQSMWFSDADSCRDHRAGRGSKDPAAPGEDRPGARNRSPPGLEQSFV